MSKDITDALLQATKCPVDGGFLDAGQYGNATVEELNQARHEITRLRAALAGAVEMTERSSEEIDRLETALATARDDALEEAAGAVEDGGWYHSAPDTAWDVADNQIEYSAAIIRALKSQPECETCRGDPETCASVPGLHHCERAMRRRS